MIKFKLVAVNFKFKQKWLKFEYKVKWLSGLRRCVQVPVNGAMGPNPTFDIDFF